MKRRLERTMRRLLKAIGWCGLCGEFHRTPALPKLSDPADTIRWTVEAVTAHGQVVPLSCPETRIRFDAPGTARLRPT